MTKYKILLGGIGDDAHSIGISLLRIGLIERGYSVTFLGIQNTLEDFIDQSRFHHIIMISCMNGHSNLYINDKIEKIKLIKDDGKLWYLGGNISVQKDVDHLIRFYKEQGFTRVFAKPIIFEEMLHFLNQDIERLEIKPIPLEGQPKNHTQKILNISKEVTDNPIDHIEFENMRKNVLQSWETGKEVSYQKGYKNYKRNCNLDDTLWEAALKNEFPLIQPRTGIAEIEKQEQLLKTLYLANMNVSSIQLDAASRRGYFDKAKEGVEISRELGNSWLNGFPIPIYGVRGVERLVNCLDIPFQIRGGAPDHRFVYEVGLAGGASGVEGGFLCYLLPYEKETSPIESLQHWKYIDTLCGMYNRKFGMKINREYFGPLTTTLIEPSIPIVINIVQAILSAKQGVKSISLGIAEQGNRSQDIAALRVLKKATDYYLYKNGFRDVKTTTVFHQYMGAFPVNENKAEQLIIESATTAALGRATRVMVKTPVEAFKIPSVDENIRGINCVKLGFEKAKITKLNHTAIEREIKLLMEEVATIMNVIEELGAGQISRGAIQALVEGILDIPFSPNKYNKGEAISFRNIDGAIRFATCNNIPFPEHIKDFHKQELLNRQLAENGDKLYSILEKDLTRIGKGDYKKWPLDGCYAY